MESNKIKNITSTNTIKLFPLYLIAVLSQLTVLILWFVPIFNASIISQAKYMQGSEVLKEKFTTISTSVSISQQFKGGALAINLLFIILMAVSLVFLVKPNLFNLSHPLFFTEIFTIANLINFAVIVIAGKYRMGEYSDIGADFTLSVAGWIFLAASIILFITMCLLEYFRSEEAQK